MDKNYPCRQLIRSLESCHWLRRWSQNYAGVIKKEVSQPQLKEPLVNSRGAAGFHETMVGFKLIQCYKALETSVKLMLS